MINVLITLLLKDRHSNQRYNLKALFKNKVRIYCKVIQLDPLTVVLTQILFFKRTYGSANHKSFKIKKLAK